jgi:hypothetical protein
MRRRIRPGSVNPPRPTLRKVRRLGLDDDLSSIQTLHPDELESSLDVGFLLIGFWRGKVVPT